MLKSELESLEDCKPLAVVVPEWGNKTVYVRAICAGDRKALEDLHGQDPPPPDLVIRDAVFFLCDEDGTPLYDDMEEGVKSLSKRNARALNRIVQEGYQLNTLTVESQEEVKKKLEAQNSSNS